MKLIYIVILLILNSTLTLASPVDEHFLVYQEKQYTVVKDIVTPENALQTVKKTWRFSSAAEASHFLRVQARPINTPAFDRKTQTEVPDQVIWKATNKWSWDWEIKYGQWIVDNLDKQFFVRYNIATDCANVAFALRWIFARINSLPAAQSLAISETIFSNESMKAEWAKLPTDPVWYKDQRFMAALNYLLDNTYTHTLFEDSYPIAIQPETLLPGTYFLILRGYDGHTLIVSKFDKNHNILTDCSNEPKIVRPLIESFFDYSEQPEFHNGAYGGGFLKMRWPIKTPKGWELTPIEQMPNYSLEQYDPSFVQITDGVFSEAVHMKLNKNFDVKIFFHNMMESLIGSIQDRIGVVEDGFAFCSHNDCSDNSENYNDYSTPSRDQKIKEEIQTLMKLLHDNVTQYPDLQTQWNQAQATPFDIDSSHKMALSQIIRIWENGSYSSNPRDSVIKRWGL